MDQYQAFQKSPIFTRKISVPIMETYAEKCALSRWLCQNVFGVGADFRSYPAVSFFEKNQSRRKDLKHIQIDSVFYADSNVSFVLSEKLINPTENKPKKRPVLPIRTKESRLPNMKANFFPKKLYMSLNSHQEEVL